MEPTFQSPPRNKLHIYYHIVKISHEIGKVILLEGFSIKVQSATMNLSFNLIDVLYNEY